MVVLAAALLSAAFPPISIWPLGVVGYGLFFFALSKSKRPVFHAFLFGFISSLLILSWSKVYVGVPPYLALALMQSLFSLPLGFYFKYRFKIAWLPFVFLLLEFLRERVPFGGFGWTQVGYTLIDSPLSHLASVGGVYLLSLWTVSFFFVRNVKQLILLSIFILVSFFIHNPDGGEDIKIAAIQGSVPPRSESFDSDIRKVFDNHFTLTQKVHGVDLIAWPEDVVDGSPVDKEFAPQFKNLHGTPLLVGSVPLIDGKPENRSEVINIQGKIVSSYTKQSLVPFGEYIPLRSIVSKLNSHVDEVRDFRPGNEMVVHEISNSKIASIICFEIVDPRVVRNAAKNANVLISQTNSATFLGTFQAEQQFAITRMRAIEYSRPILSVSTAGITGFIDNNGRVQSRALINEPTILYGSMKENSYITFYSKFPYISLLIALLFGLLGRRRDETRHSYSDLQ